MLTFKSLAGPKRLLKNIHSERRTFLIILVINTNYKVSIDIPEIITKKNPTNNSAFTQSHPPFNLEQNFYKLKVWSGTV